MRPGATTLAFPNLSLFLYVTHVGTSGDVAELQKQRTRAKRIRASDQALILSKSHSIITTPTLMLHIASAEEVSTHLRPTLRPPDSAKVLRKMSTRTH